MNIVRPLAPGLSILGMLSGVLPGLFLAVHVAVAQQAPVNTFDAADPGAPVPPVAYRSVFTGLPLGVEDERDDWIKANAEAGRFTRGHVDILKWEQQQQAGTRGAAAPDPKPAAPGHKH